MNGDGKINILIRAFGHYSVLHVLFCSDPESNIIAPQLFVYVLQEFNSSWLPRQHTCNVSHSRFVAMVLN